MSTKVSNRERFIQREKNLELVDFRCCKSFAS
jgi:hypothetical protein